MSVDYSEDAVIVYLYIQVVGQFYFEKRQAQRWQYIYMLCFMILTLKYYSLNFLLANFTLKQH